MRHHTNVQSQIQVLHRNDNHQWQLVSCIQTRPTWRPLWAPCPSSHTPRSAWQWSPPCFSLAPPATPPPPHCCATGMPAGRTQQYNTSSRINTTSSWYTGASQHHGGVYTSQQNEACRLESNLQVAQGSRSCTGPTIWAPVYRHIVGLQTLSKVCHWLTFTVPLFSTNHLRSSSMASPLDRELGGRRTVFTVTIHWYYDSVNTDVRMISIYVSI